MSLIFIGSSDVLSAAHTSRFVVPFLRWLLGGSFTLEKAAYVHFLIRKGGHLTEYAVLAVLLWRALGSLAAFSKQPEDRPVQQRNRFLLAIALAAIYAASDEFHQSFIPTRTASPVDVMIDTVGAMLGLLLFLGGRNILRRNNKLTWLRPG